MKAICKISHEQIAVEGGGFKRYEAEQIYEGDDFDEALFEIVGAGLVPAQTGGDEPLPYETNNKTKRR